MKWLELPAWKVGDRGFVPRSGIQVSKKDMFIPRSLVNTQFSGDPPLSRDSELGFRPPGLGFSILCLEDSGISFISPSSRSKGAFVQV